MTAALLNFDKENSLEIGSNFEATLQIFDAPNLLDFTGKCDVRSTEDATTTLIQPTIAVLSHDTFTISIPFNNYNNNFVAGSYPYDVLFYSTSYRFYALRGKMTFIKTITKI